MGEALVKVCSSYPLSFSLLDINDKILMAYTICLIDNANGYYFNPDRLANNEKEKQMDFETLSNYVTTEGIMDLEDRYFG